MKFVLSVIFPLFLDKFERLLKTYQLANQESDPLCNTNYLLYCFSQYHQNYTYLQAAYITIYQKIYLLPYFFINVNSLSQDRMGLTTL
jgi:hypothetical protein